MINNPAVIVTGASRGLGEVTAKILTQLGAVVVLTARPSADLERVGATIKEISASSLTIPGDIGETGDCHRLVQQTIENFGRLDAIINNAGVLEPIASIADSSPAIWAKNIEINLLGPYYLTHYALPYLRAQKGRVINVSSGSAIHADAGWSAYCAAKAGLNHFTSVLAVEEPDITAIAFRPGKMNTAMQATIREKGKAGMPPDTYSQFVQFYEKGELPSPRISGIALAVLALHTPQEWSGEFVAVNDERVKALVAEKSGAIGNEN